MKLNRWLILLLIVGLAAFLRFYRIAANPPSPYWEEAALGYDAYSILKTGKDFHGSPWPVVAFESFGDFKPSLYFYALVPFIKFFGLGVLAVRLPSALLGTCTVGLVYFLVFELGKLGKKRQEFEWLGLLSSLLLAVSPWHLQVSRAGFETNLALFLVVLGSILFVKGLKQGYWLVVATLIWGLSVYAYHATRVFVPLLGFFWGLWFIKKLWQRKQWTIAAAAGLLIMFAPILLQLNQPQVKKRFAETSALATLEPVLESNRLIAEDGGGRIARLVHHRAWHYLNILTNNYSDHFLFPYLFLTGDDNPRHSTQMTGNLYLVQFPFLILGLFYLFYRKEWTLLPLLVWLLLAPVPAALTKATPHALRSLSMVVPLAVFSSYGALQLVKEIKYKKLVIVGWLVAAFVLSIEVGRYLFIYHVDYPKDYSFYWQFGYREMVEYVSAKKDSYEQIFITRDYGRPSIYWWFYNQTDPRKVQALNEQVAKDQGEYLEFENLRFGSLPGEIPESSLIVAPAEQSFESEPAKIITNPKGEAVFKIYEN